MSGFEIIGVVLGAYPIVLTLCQKYRAARSGEGFEKLIRRLDIEQFLFEDFVSRLLGPDVEESELIRLKTSKDVDCWKHNNLQEKLEQRHGFKKTKHIISILQDLSELLQSISNDLPGAARSFEKQHSKLRFGFRNVKNNLSDPSTYTKLSQLKDYNQTLRLLLSDHPIPDSRGSSRQPLPAIEFPHRDHSDAKHIYSAICNGYHCHCAQPHYANIEVPQRANLPKLTWPRGQKDDSRLNILFPIEDASSPITNAFSKISLQEKQYNDPPPPYPKPPKSILRLSRSDMSNSTIISSKSGSRKSRAISVRECDDDQNEPIPDLCNFVKTFGGTPGTTENELGILHSEKRKYKLQSPGSNNQETRDTVSLDELTSSDKSSLPRADRISLAVRLTYAIISYYSTGWIDSEWTWKNFSISGHEYKYSDLSQLFVAQKFYSASGQTAKPSIWVGWESIGEPKLTRLGFALIELALGKRLSEMRDATIDLNMDPDAQDYFTATRLLNTGRILREEGEGYENVVRACLEHQFRDAHYTMKYLDSRNATFHKDVEQCILKPLHCMWKEPWGRSQRQLCY